MSIKTLTQLREKLLGVFEGLGSDQVDVKTAAEMNNCAGKIIKTVGIQLEYSSQRKETPDIPFMNN